MGESLVYMLSVPGLVPSGVPPLLWLLLLWLLLTPAPPTIEALAAEPRPEASWVAALEENDEEEEEE